MSYKTVNIHEAKTHLSKIIKQVVKSRKGVTICNAGEPLVELTPINKPASGKRIAGRLAGKIIIADDFDEMPEEFMNYFK